MKTSQKHKTLFSTQTSFLCSLFLSWCLLFIIGSCSTADLDVSQNPSTGVTVSGCPTDITQEVSGAGSTAVVTWTPPTAVDSNGTPVTNVAQSHNSGDSFPLGDTEVTVTFTDDASNEATCTFTVTVSQPSSTAVTVSWLSY